MLFWVPSLRHLTHTLGFGSVASPLVCQSIIATGVPWFHFYLGSLVLSALNVIFLAVTFKPSSAEFAKEHQVALDEARARVTASCSAADDAGQSEKALPLVLRCKSENDKQKSRPLRSLIRRKFHVNIFTSCFPLDFISPEAGTLYAISMGLLRVCAALLWNVSFAVSRQNCLPTNVREHSKRNDYAGLRTLHLLSGEEEY